MSTTSRTLGPLHLEDLDPHRFEDLVRQLLYDFRDWRQLEATGRSGADKGFDVRGWEIVSREFEEPEEEEDEGLAEPSMDRLWLVQCKREKSIGPKKIERYMDEIPEAERINIYGVVFAAACNFSKTARDRFRDRCRKFSFAEGHLWGKGEIEDMLFQPKNDHLLFAYFGVSLQARKRSLKTAVRAKLAIKRKAMRHLTPDTEVLVRDASDDRYPYLDRNKSKKRMERGNWMVMKYSGCFSNGLHFVTRRHFAFLDTDGEHWDFAECMNDARPHPRDDPWRDKDNPDDREGRNAAWAIWEPLPEENKSWFEVGAVLPYENVIDIDEKGDENFEKPHIYTTPWLPVRGPFEQDSWDDLETIGYARRSGSADLGKRVEKFARKEDSKA